VELSADVAKQCAGQDDLMYSYDRYERKRGMRVLIAAASVLALVLLQPAGKVVAEPTDQEIVVAGTLLCDIG
jgi:hypothetical protein